MGDTLDRGQDRTRHSRRLHLQSCSHLRMEPPTFGAAPLRGVDQEEVPGVGEARRVTAVRAHGPKRQLVIPVDGQGSEAHPGDVDEPAGAGRTGCGSLRAALGRVHARRACSDRRSGLRHAADSGHGRHERTATGGRAGAAARPAPRAARTPSPGRDPSPVSLPPTLQAQWGLWVPGPQDPQAPLPSRGLGHRAGVARACPVMAPLPTRVSCGRPTGVSQRRGPGGLTGPQPVPVCARASACAGRGRGRGVGVGVGRTRLALTSQGHCHTDQDNPWRRSSNLSPGD